MEGLELGSIIQIRRIERGFSRTEFAQQCNLSRSTIFKIEKGQRYPTANTIINMAEVLGVTVKSLIAPIACPLCGHVAKDK